MSKHPGSLFAAAVSVIAISVLAASSQSAGNPAIKFEESEVRFANGTIGLAATILLPKGSGLFPAVVIAHGSGSSTRSNPWTTAYATALAQRGVAVLHPDKRGSGKSQGDWRTASFSDLADDTLAGVELLSKDVRIDKARIGVIGFSQGGDIIPIAATRTSNISFVISVSGSTVPIHEQMSDELEIAAERAGLTAKQIAVIKNINALGIAYAMTAKGWDEYKTALDAARSGEVKGQPIVAGFPTTPDHWMAGFVRSVGDFDPIPYWKKTTVPALFIYGGQDTNVRVHKSIRRIQQTLSADKRNYSVMLFNGNGHGLFRDDAIAFIVQWIADKGAT